MELKELTDKTLSLFNRYKEMKFEVKDFDELPEMISIFLNMWRQRMMSLNNEENRMLIELRDTLLPDLMSGKISLCEESEDNE